MGKHFKLRNIFNSSSSAFNVFLNRKMAIIGVLGFSSGLPLALSGGTLQAWLATTEVGITTIGIMGLVGLPYTLKFLWAPMMDRFNVCSLGRRKGWILTTQVTITLTLFAMAATDPSSQILSISILALSLAFLSASQDITFDAFRTDSLAAHERGAGAGLSVLGYRIAMIVSGAAALVLADRIGFRFTYLLMATLMIIASVATVLSKEPTSLHQGPSDFTQAVVLPFSQFFARGKIAIYLIILIIAYKLGDAFAGSLTTTFLLRGPGFSLSEVGAINKTLGIIVSIFGAIFGGALLSQIGLYKSLLFFGLLQAVSNLTFVVLAYMGKSYFLLVFAVGFEQLAGGMGTAAFVALIMSLCDSRYTATQFALLSAAAAFGRVFVGPPSGYLVEALGWGPFFLLTFLIALPGIFLLVFLRKDLE